MTDEFREQFKSLSGGETPESFADALRNMPTDKAVETVKKNREALAYVRGIYQERPKFISDAQDELISHERGYGDATKPEHPELSKVQLNWLERIGAYLIKEVMLNKESFDAPQFKIKGGYAAIDKAFGNKLDVIIDEINNHMYTA